MSLLYALLSLAAHMLLGHAPSGGWLQVAVVSVGSGCGWVMLGTWSERVLYASAPLVREGVSPTVVVRQKSGKVLLKFDAGGLAGADLAGVQLPGANLMGADLRGANLRGANLERALLKGANLEGADLRNARLGAANLAQCVLRNTDLRGADFRGDGWNRRMGAGSLLLADFTGSRYDASTRWSGSFSPEARGSVLIPAPDLNE